MSGIDVSRCRVMESKKKPLLLVLVDADSGKDIQLIVKVSWYLLVVVFLAWKNAF